MIYIHKDINFWKTKVKLPDSYLISTDIDDYEVGAYLPLSEEQEQYHNEHPDATPLECWHMQPAPEPEPTPEELLWRARDAKRQEIYDKDIHHYCFGVPVMPNGRKSTTKTSIIIILMNRTHMSRTPCK